MSNSSPRNTKFNISQLSLAGDGAWPDLQVDKLSAELNVFYGNPRSGKSSIAQLVGHLLYGKSDSQWRQQFGQTVSAAEGSMRLAGSAGDFIMRRHRGSNDRNATKHESERAWHLTISSDQGDAVDSQTIQNLLSGVTPQLAAQLFLVDFAESPQVDWLLNENFAREFSTSRSTEPSQLATRKFSCCLPTEGSSVDRVDRRRVDELVKRRDSIAGEIEQQIAVRRRESEVLERELSEVDGTLANKREQAQRLQAELHRLESELAGLETRLRYFSLDRFAKHDERRLEVDQQQQRELKELDNEITRCRQTLVELQQRESLLRTELAQISPDGTADSVTCLADGRATLGVLEQLLDDLDAEVSQLARANEPGRCVGHDSHAKLSPVASLLRQQVYTLCGQLTEQERFVRRQQLTTETRQISRVLAEQGERLDLLLSRRESLIQRTQMAAQPARLIPQPPAVEHCRCDHHGEFVQVADAMVLGRSDQGRHESDARSQLSILQRKRTQLLDDFNALQGEIVQLEQRWERLQSERGGLIGAASIDDKQAELERLELVIRQTLQTTTPAANRITTRHWRASDVLAQLTNGELVQIRLERQQAKATIVDRHGRSRVLESLSAAEHDQLYLALTLSLVSSYEHRGIHLPLILDEPFLKQEPVQAAVMAGVLEEFARTGHQVLVFTEDREVMRRFATLSATIFNVEELRRLVPTHETTTPVAVESAPTIQTTNTHIIRETHDGHHTPVLRLATVDGEALQDDVFYLTENSTFGDFPVLGAETSITFDRINIYSIQDLLAADAETIAQQLARDGITTSTVRLWQIHMSLMCHVPNLTLDDAQVLAANGIDSPAELFDADIDALLVSIEGFLRSERGRRFQRSGRSYSRSQLSNWQSGSRRYRDRWQRSSRRYSGRRSNRSSSERTYAQRTESRRSENPRTEQRRTERRSSGTKSTSQRKARRKLKFYLSREQDVEDAPSIGPKTATRLAKVGIRSINDLLNADPETTSAELDVSHISAETFAAWQHQARLVCQIPQLRGYGAQLLVACGMTQPEQIARTTPDALVSQILSFCETKEGQRILRSGDAPAREKIAEWVELASQSRPLEAA